MYDHADKKIDRSGQDRKKHQPGLGGFVGHLKCLEKFRIENHDAKEKQDYAGAAASRQRADRDVAHSIKPHFMGYDRNRFGNAAAGDPGVKQDDAPVFPKSGKSGPGHSQAREPKYSKNTARRPEADRLE